MKQVIYAVGGVMVALVASASGASAQQVMWKDNPISGKVVGLTYGTSGWTAAEAQAVAYGGHLVTVRNQSEQDWLVANFSGVWGNGIANGSGPWIGLHEQAGQGSPWVWTSAESTTYLNWWGVEPNNAGGNEVAAHLLPPENQFKWNDAPDQFNVRSLIEVDSRPARSWSWPTAYGTGARPEFGCAFDMDGDSDMDYASPDRDSGQISLWRNNGTGVFTAAGVIGGAGSIFTVQPNDHDGDGDLDLYGADTNGRLLLARNGGASWSLEQLAAVPACHGVTAADLNNDGRTDIITSSVGSDDRMRVFLRQSDGSLATPSVYGPFFDEAYETSVADLDGDGWLDVLVAGGGTRLMRGSRTGVLLDVGGIGSGLAHFGMAADLNADGIAEIVLPRLEGDRVEVWSRTSAGPLSSANYTTTQDLPCGDGPHWVSVSDLDGDGDSDVVVPSHISDTVHILRNEGGVLVQDHVFVGRDYALFNALVDLNGDAKPDIITSDYFANAFSVNFNQSIFDCNGNSIDDPLDIASGFSTDCNSNGRPDTCDLAFGISQDSDGDGLINECEPTLVSLTPSTLPAATGGTVTVTGTNIPNGTVRLDLNGIPLPFTMTNNTGTVTIPPLAAPSASDVTVSGTLGFLNTQGQPEVTGSTPAVFTWDVPEVVAVTPGSAPYDQYTGVVYTVEDNTILSGSGTAVFGNAAPQAAYLFTANGLSKLVTTAPPQPTPGPVEVLFTIGAERTLAARGFVYLGPGITNTSVNNGWQAGGEPLTLELVDFLPGVPVDVRIGTGVATGSPTGLLAASSLTVTTPYTASAGVVDLELVQNAGQPNEKRVLTPGAWLADAPQVVGATPAAAYQGGGDAVSLAVAGFVPGTVARVEIGSTALGYISVDAPVVGTLDAAMIDFVMPLAPFAGACDVVVTQQGGTPSELRAVAAGAFTVVGASIASLSPTSGPLEGGTPVVVQTSGFQEGAPAQVVLGGKTVVGTVVGSGANQTVTFRTTLATASGPSDVNITQGVFNAVLPAAYTFDAPRVIGYCTPKPTSQGTVPVIGFSGSPGVAAGDFRITLSNALPNKTAQYFYGPATSNFPIYGGTLCVGGSITRGPMSATNAQSAASVPFAVTGLLVGQKRYIQWWFRDPLDPFGRGFSAGLEVEFYN